MKVYCFYLVMDEIIPQEYPGVFADTIQQLNGKDYSLYAFTQNKEFVKFFKKNRDMNKFIYKVVDVDDLEEFINDHDGYLLEFHSVRIKEIINGEERISFTEILMTKEESDYILFYSDTAFIDSIIDSHEFNSINVMDAFNLFDAFKKSIRKSLEMLCYIDLIQGAFFDVEETSYDGILITDQLSIYTKVFGNTFKRGEKNGKRRAGTNNEYLS